MLFFRARLSLWAGKLGGDVLKRLSASPQARP
jgi:hypothetical protein